MRYDNRIRDDQLNRLLLQNWTRGFWVGLLTGGIISLTALILGLEFHP